MCKRRTTTCARELRHPTIQPIGQHLASGPAQYHARAHEVRHFFIAPWQHATSVVELVIRVGELFEVASHPMWLSKLRGRRDDCEGTQTKDPNRSDSLSSVSNCG